MIPSISLYLIPIPIADKAWYTIPKEVFEVVPKLQYFFVENAKTARQALKQINPDIDFTSIQIATIDKHNGWDDKLLLEWWQAGYSVGVLSEAGCPAVADPGSELVAFAHKHGKTVRALTGPNSLLLALMGSGFNGQQFTFHGYLPIDKDQRKKQIVRLGQQTNYTHIFIETPYRNHQLLQDLIQFLPAQKMVSIAKYLTSENAMQKTKPLKDWQKDLIFIEKVPMVFLF
jgi:16S rRNA (cytidine1402-2'-O)-methyltransferase